MTTSYPSFQASSISSKPLHLHSATWLSPSVAAAVSNHSKTNAWSRGSPPLRWATLSQHLRSTWINFPSQNYIISSQLDIQTLTKENNSNFTPDFYLSRWKSSQQVSPPPRRVPQMSQTMFPELHLNFHYAPPDQLMLWKCPFSKLSSDQSPHLQSQPLSRAISHLNLSSWHLAGSLF